MMRMTKLAMILGAAAILAASAQVPARAEMVKLTILGVGDIYDFGVTKERGGFARMNAVAKAEKAANPNTLYVFDGDMFSPSLLSGFDKGAHTVELTNHRALRHRGARQPRVRFRRRWLRGQREGVEISLGGAQHHPCRRLADRGARRHDDEGDRRPQGGAGAGGARIRRNELSSPGDWKFGGTVKTAVDGAKAARAAGADLVIGVVHASHAEDRELWTAMPSTSSCRATTTTSDRAMTAITAYVETSTEAKLSRSARSRGDDQGEERQAHGQVGADLPLHRHQDGDARPGDRRRWSTGSRPSSTRASMS